MSLLSALSSRLHRDGSPRWRVGQSRFDDDADLRRIEHDIEAIRTRFSGGDRR